MRIDFASDLLTIRLRYPTPEYERTHASRPATREAAPDRPDGRRIGDGFVHDPGADSGPEFRHDAGVYDRTYAPRPDHRLFPFSEVGKGAIGDERGGPGKEERRTQGQRK